MDKHLSSIETRPAFQLTVVRSRVDLAAVIELFHEYVQWLDIDLGFQSFAAEMEAMPGKYAPPTGALLLARNMNGEPIGCVALRANTDNVGEMKRLWVRDSAKGLGVGKALVLAIIDLGKNLGYTSIRLDTLPRMTAAISMYQNLGFVDIPAYYKTPLTGTRFLERQLS